MWYSAEQVYPGRTFRNYALLGDDIVIGDDKVAKVYRDIMDQLGLKIPLAKTLTSDIGALEFAKKFRILERDLSPVSVKMIRSTRFSVAWMPVLRSVNCTSLRVSLRLRGAGYRRYSTAPKETSYLGITGIGSVMFLWPSHLVESYHCLSPSGLVFRMD